MKRIHVSEVVPGEITLDQDEAHHIRNVLRLDEGVQVEAFDNSGKTGIGIIHRCDARQITIRINQVREPKERGFQWIVASAVPKGARVDWMIEKLCELGTAEFIPLAATRSVALPAGKSKPERWQRIATEAAKQSRRAGVMRIGELTSLAEILRRLREQPSSKAWYLSTSPPCQSIDQAFSSTFAVTPAQLQSAAKPGNSNESSLLLLVGPEGGWTDDEIDSFQQSGLTPVSLGETILRIETAAVAAAAIVAAVFAPAMNKHSIRENQ